jgi:thiol-disulfide isomerase/thioredoxin
MSRVALLLVSMLVMIPLVAQEADHGPANPKAQGTYKKAQEHLQRHEILAVFDDFKKADRQDEGHCLECQKAIIKYGIDLQEWKAAEIAAQEMMAEAKDDKQTAVSHYQFGVVLMREALQKHKDELFMRAHEEMAKALAAYANYPDAVFTDGQALARLKQDDAAKARFEQFVNMKTASEVDRQRAMRLVNRPELARERLAPAFWVKTSDGQRISMDDLQGKVVLMDFWATWCGPCRAALPHMKEIVKKFQGQPLLVLSVGLDDDPQQWKDFIAKNQMSWPQYYDGGFNGPISTLFGVHAIPHTFTIDSDGVLQDEHIGDASIEGKLKKLLAKVQEAHAQKLEP